MLEIAEKLGLRDQLMEHWCYPDMVAANNADSAGNGDDFVTEIKVDNSNHEFRRASFDTLEKCGFFRGGCEEHADYGTFLQKGYLPIRFKDDWRDDPVGMRAFYEDPDHHPAGHADRQDRVLSPRPSTTAAATTASARQSPIGSRKATRTTSA